MDFAIQAALSRFTRQGVGAAARAGDPPRVAPSGANRARPPWRAGRRPASAVSRPERGAGASRLLSFVVVDHVPRSLNRQAKAAAYCAAGINPRRIGWELFSLGRSLECPMSCSSLASPLGRSVRPRNDEGDPLGRPRSDGYAADWLACAPPVEGPSVVAQQCEITEQPDECPLLARVVPHGRRGHGNTSSVNEGVGGHSHRPEL